MCNQVSRQMYIKLNLIPPDKINPFYQVVLTHVENLPKMKMDEIHLKVLSPMRHQHISLKIVKSI